MSLPLILSAEAQVDFDDAFDWYEAQRPGLGVDFTAGVQATFNRISANPLIHAAFFQDVRKALVAHLATIPIAAVVTLDEDRVDALAHQRERQRRHHRRQRPEDHPPSQMEHELQRIRRVMLPALRRAERFGPRRPSFSQGA